MLQFLFKKVPGLQIRLPRTPHATVTERMFRSKVTSAWSLLKVPSCKLYNNKYMIAPTQITNTEIFAFIAVLVFKLLSRKDLFINRKGNGNC